MALIKDTFRYFSHDADMRNDIKIKALRRKFGAKGYAVWCFLLETLTDKENFEIEFNDIETELLAADFEVSVEELQAVIEYCVKINLLQIEDHRLFSNRHKERFSEMEQSRQKKSLAGKIGMQKRWGDTKSDTTCNIEKSNTDNSVITKNDSVITKITKEKRIEKNRKEENRKEENVDYNKVVEIWNEVIQNPKVAKLTDDRRRKVKARIEEWQLPTPAETEKRIHEIFGKVSKSDFLSGRTGDWRATFDWVFANEKNSVKILEGNYDNRKGSNDNNIGLGIGEYITDEGRRTYGTGKANIPLSAAPRPSEIYSWNAETNEWIIL